MKLQLPKQLKRRDFVRMGTVAGLGLADIMRMQHLFASDKGERSDVNCIFIFIVGGMPQQDMWDLKPEAPAEIRGDFQNINTSVPGIHISDVLPGCSTVVDKMAILRSMTHDDSDHGRGFHVMMSGKRPARATSMETRTTTSTHVSGPWFLIWGNRAYCHPTFPSPTSSTAAGRPSWGQLTDHL
jgi:hypothetical protein